MVATSTHFVIDESGSMRDLEDGVYEGVQQMLAELPTESHVAFSRFNEIVTVGARQGRDGVAEFARGMCSGRTALYDAILAAIAEEEEDPIANTHIVVITDGQDNASRGTAADVSAAVTRVRGERAWTVSFMGCNQDAVLTARMLLGVEERHALTYEASASGMKTAFRALSDNISEFAAGGHVADFTQLQRQTSLPSQFGSETAAFLAPPKLCRQKSCMDGVN